MSELTQSTEPITLLREGDPDAFQSLFRLHYRPLCHFAYQFLKEQPASEEIVQEIFVKLWENRLTLSITTSLKSYLYAAVRNHCLNQLKHVKIRETYKQQNEQHIQYSEQQEVDYAVQQELAQRIDETIAALPTERQRIFRMSRFEDKKYQEIADELSISVKTVEAQMGKALKFLREQLAEYLPVILLCVLTTLFFFIHE